MNRQVYKAYNLLFLIQSSVRNVRIAYKDIKRVLDVIGVNENFAVLSLGVYLGNYEAIYGKYLYSKERFRYIRLNVDYNSGFETDMNKVKEAREVAWP